MNRQEINELAAEVQWWSEDFHCASAAYGAAAWIQNKKENELRLRADACMEQIQKLDGGDIDLSLLDYQIADTTEKLCELNETAYRVVYSFSHRMADAEETAAWRVFNHALKTVLGDDAGKGRAFSSDERKELIIALPAYFQTLPKETVDWNENRRREVKQLLRFIAAHELGHLVAEAQQGDSDENEANGFAATLLALREVRLRERQGGNA
ncbi:hypothetical protein FACS18949_00980 [Clostridia bacterium]|nr:hypothetical protein FACS18949_00980 [Clostridia bacterium]